MKILCFGIAKDITGNSSITIGDVDTVEKLRKELVETYPAFSEIKKCMIAVNEEYADDDLVLKPSDTIAVIPPVSGG